MEEEAEEERFRRRVPLSSLSLPSSGLVGWEEEGRGGAGRGDGTGVVVEEEEEGEESAVMGVSVAVMRVGR